MLRAMLAANSVGRPSASSSELVCRLCVWPWVAAIASTQVRVTLLQTSCAVRLQPLVWLCVRKRQAFGVLRVEHLDDLRPQHAGGPHLGDLHHDVLADRPEEREARREVVDRHAGRDAGAQIFQPVRQSITKLQIGGRAGFLHVIAGDADAVECRHVFRWCK